MPRKTFDIAVTKADEIIGRSSISHAWRALRSRNFKLFFFGQSVSMIGTWMTRLPTSWLVYRLTHSALLLGIVSFAGQVPSFAIGPFAGVWVERLNRRKFWFGPKPLPPASHSRWQAPRWRMSLPYGRSLL
jgi:hypothetical protein